MTRAKREQPCIAIIFHGAGKRIGDDEKKVWHPDVDVYWQANVWADTEVSIKWVEETLAKSVDGLECFVLFVDNLGSQESDPFKSAVTALKGVVWFGLKNATYLWQVVDAALAQMLKVLIGQVHHDWLDQEENADKWYGNESKFSASDRRILITHWTGDAWKKLCSPEYENLRRRHWEKTGCLITADGSEDDKITPEGLPSYRVPPPIDYIPAAEALPVSNEAIGEDVEDTEATVATEATEEIEDDNGNDAPVDDGDEWEDDEDDRLFYAPYCGRQMKVLYESGWYIGEVMYFNDNFQKYYVKHNDDFHDYIAEDEIDMVEVCVV